MYVGGVSRRQELGVSAREIIIHPVPKKSAQPSSKSALGPSQNAWWEHLLCVSAVCIIGALIYSNSLNGPFVFDDLDEILGNESIRLTEINHHGLWAAAFDSPSPKRPFANLSFALNYYAGGYDVTGYHLTNLVVHLASGVLVYCIALLTLRQLAGPRRAETDPATSIRAAAFAVVAAGIFVAHPIQTQSVTYVVQRMSSMAAMFYFLSLLLFILGRRSKSTRLRWLVWAGSLGAWILALGTKQTAATLPIIILLYEWYFFRDLDRGWAKRQAWLLAAALAALLLLALVYLGGNPLASLLADYGGRDFTIGERVLTQFRVLVHYLSLLIYPHPSRLSLVHEFSVSTSLLDPGTTLLSLLALGALLGFAIRIARRQRIVSFGIVWFFVTLLIESSIIGLELAFEHRLYLPMLGFALLSAAVLLRVFPGNRSFLTAGIIVILALEAVTYWRNRVWASEILLWSDVVNKSPQSARGNHNLGTALAKRGRLDEAIEGYRTTLTLDSRFKGAHYNLGKVLEIQGELQASQYHYEQAIGLDPNYAQARNNLAFLFVRQGRLEEAGRQFARMVERDPGDERARLNLRNIEMVIGGNPADLLHLESME